MPVSGYTQYECSVVEGLTYVMLYLPYFATSYSRLAVEVTVVHIQKKPSRPRR